jgi:hypothetical protein
MSMAEQLPPAAALPDEVEVSVQVNDQFGTSPLSAGWCFHFLGRDDFLAEQRHDEVTGVGHESRVRL